MAKQDVLERIHNFYEVALGYTEEQAVAEAERCLQCPKPSCIQGCPVDIDIPAFIKEIKDGNFLAASAKLKEKNSLPAICGRVCPQENQCQKYLMMGIFNADTHLLQSKNCFFPHISGRIPRSEVEIPPLIQWFSAIGVPKVEKFQFGSHIIGVA